MTGMTDCCLFVWSFPFQTSFYYTIICTMTQSRAFPTQWSETKRGTTPTGQTKRRMTTSGSEENLRNDSQRKELNEERVVQRLQTKKIESAVITNSSKSVNSHWNHCFNRTGGWWDRYTRITFPLVQIHSMTMSKCFVFDMKKTRMRRRFPYQTKKKKKI